jgi:hypothetical protein
MSKLLAEALQADAAVRAPKSGAYLDARRKFEAMLAPDDYSYISFQFWKEGIARYTEYELARLAATKFRPSRDFRALKDYRSFADVAQSTYAGILKQLENQNLGKTKREVVYSYGAAEGLLLDQIKPGWKRRYLAEKFDLGKYW